MSKLAPALENQPDTLEQVAEDSVPLAPAWITPELIADTIETWQPYYVDRLTADDALEILLNVGAVIETLER